MKDPSFPGRHRLIETVATPTSRMAPTAASSGKELLLKTVLRNSTLGESLRRRRHLASHA